MYIHVHVCTLLYIHVHVHCVQKGTLGTAIHTCTWLFPMCPLLGLELHKPKDIHEHVVPPPHAQGTCERLYAHYLWAAQTKTHVQGN